MRKAIDNLSAVLAVVAAACVMAMMILTCLDSAMRWTTGRSVAGIQEIVESLMVAIVFLGMAYALRRGEHVSVRIVTGGLPVRWGALVRLIGMAAMIGLAAWMTLRTGQNAWRSFVSGEVRFGLLQIPIWPARLTIPLGIAAFILQALPAVADQIRVLRGGRAADAGSPRHNPSL
jgi:TRAP-type C4-dicarboxylate transport system permease small subunit